LSTDNYLQDIYPDLVLPDGYVEDFKFINIMIANDQQIMINKIITYIDGNNYYGDEYHSYKNKSINATKWWFDKFFKDKNNSADNLKYLKNLVDYNNKEKQIYFTSDR
jgi:hypothetical protein